jgi:hypothetical protein
MKRRFSKVLMIFILFSSLGWTTPPYVECQDVYPDEWLDLFGTFQNSVGLTTVLIAQPAAFSFSDFIPTRHIFQTHDSEGFDSQAFALERVSSVTLRC